MQSVSIGVFSRVCEIQGLPIPTISRDGAIITKDLYDYYTGYAEMLKDWLFARGKSINNGQYSFLAAWDILYARHMDDINRQVSNNKGIVWKDIYFR